MKKQGSNEYFTNVIYVLMQIHGINANEAKTLMKTELTTRQNQYDQDLKEILKCLSGNSPEARFFGLLDLMIAGNALWSMTAPRYHKDVPKPQRRAKKSACSEGKSNSLPMSQNQPCDNLLHQIHDSDLKKIVLDRPNIDNSGEVVVMSDGSDGKRTPDSLLTTSAKEPVNSEASKIQDRKEASKGVGLLDSGATLIQQENITPVEGLTPRTTLDDKVSSSGFKFV